MTNELEPVRGTAVVKAAFRRSLVMKWAALTRQDRGAATAEYAVVSVAAAGLGGILIKLLTSDWFQEILKTILNWIVKIVLNFFGFGG
jgi:hypothetical protein